MATTQAEIVIDRPLAEVWDYTSDPDNVATFNTSVIEYAQLSEGPRGIGTRDRGTVKVAGKRIDFEQEVVDYKERERAVFRSVEAPMGMEWELTWRFEEAGDGATRVVFHQEAALGGFFGRLGDAIVEKLYGKDVRASLENLKTLLEEA